jgi:hypothetical protein
MLTPEEQKLFDFLNKLMRTYGKKWISFNYYFDYGIPNENEDMTSMFSESDWPNPVTIPTKAAEMLNMFYKKYIFPELDDAGNKLRNSSDFNEVGNLTLSVEIYSNPRQVIVTLSGDYYGEEEPSLETENFDDNVYNSIANYNPGVRIVSARVEYSGSGDSGVVQDEIILTTSEGNQYSYPLTVEVLSVVESLVPGGFGNDTGSQGSVVFDMETKEATLEHVWNTYETLSTEILRFDY